MQGRKRARRNRLAALGMLLCVLAAVFAVEAKLGWYSPDTAARVELSATKLRADEAPKLIANAHEAPAPAPNLLPQPVLFFAVVLAAAFAVFPSDPSPVLAKTAASPGSFPPVFLRPPPRR